MPDWIEKAAAECAFGINLAESDFPMQEKVFAAIIRRHYEAASQCDKCHGSGRLANDMYGTNPRFVICGQCSGTGKVLPNA